MTGLAQVLFPWRANGSLVTDEKGQVVGSELIAQGFANPAYFQPRPSAAGEKGYDAANSSGSNLGPTSKKLQDRIKDDLKRLEERKSGCHGAGSGRTGYGVRERPRSASFTRSDAVAGAASGEDTRRIAERVKAVVDSNVEGRTFGILGEPRVNVLLVNLALDRQFGKATPLPPAPEKKETKEAPKESAAPAQPTVQTPPPPAQ